MIMTEEVKTEIVPAKKRKPRKDLGGRPSEMIEANINKLREVFALDGTIAEACYYANISTQTYYNWIEKNPKLVDEFEALRNRPVLKARGTVIKALDQPEIAFRYLERKAKKEFSQRSELDVNLNLTISELLNDVEKNNKDVRPKIIEQGVENLQPLEDNGQKQ